MRIHTPPITGDDVRKTLADTTIIVASLASDKGKKSLRYFVGTGVYDVCHGTACVWSGTDADKAAEVYEATAPW